MRTLNAHTSPPTLASPPTHTPPQTHPATPPPPQGFFGQYLSGSMILVVMGIGSTAPGILQVAIDQFSQVFPDYKQRVTQHEAAHFLVGYLLGVPVTNYSVAMTKEHVEFAEVKLQARIFTKDLTEDEVSALAAVAVAGEWAGGSVCVEGGCWGASASSRWGGGAFASSCCVGGGGSTY